MYLYNKTLKWVTIFGHSWTIFRSLQKFKVFAHMQFFKLVLFCIRKLVWDPVLEL
jgi:hypothetical protein